jgi:hypothetical protein
MTDCFEENMCFCLPTATVNAFSWLRHVHDHDETCFKSLEKNEEHARLVFKHAETSGDDKDKKTW